MADRYRTLGALALGLGYLLAGGALLLQELDLILRWTYVLQLIPLTVGVVLLLSGLRAAGASVA